MLPPPGVRTDSDAIDRAPGPEAPAILDLDATVLQTTGNGWLKELNDSLAGHYEDQRNIVLLTAQALAQVE